MVWDQRRLRSGRAAAPGRLINYREGRGEEEEEDWRGERANEVRSRQRNGPKEKFIAGQGPVGWVAIGRSAPTQTQERRHRHGRTVALCPLTHLFEFVADEGERLVDGVRGARDGDDPLRTRAVADVDLGAALKEDGERGRNFHVNHFCGISISTYLISESLDDLALLANDAPDLLKRMEKRGRRC